MKNRIGIGYDVHKLVEGRKCILGGVELKDSKLGLLGHSDADVLIHAISDAILGACALPDIGHFFPDTSQACKDMDSKIILIRAIEEAKKMGYNIGNIDTVIIAETPKISPHIISIKESLSNITGLKVSEIGIKATTNEKMGWIGRKEGVAVQAVCILEKI